MKKGKRAFISPKNELEIEKWATQDIATDRNKLAIKLQQEVKWRGLAPEVEVLEKKISKYRRHPKSPIDMPWSILSLSNPEHEIPSESLPSVLKVWAYTLKEKITPLTIRQARWVARLRALFLDGDTGYSNETHWLYEYAMIYAAYEKSTIRLNTEADEVVRTIGFNQDTKLYIDYVVRPVPSTDEIINIKRDPYTFKQRKEAILQELRSPETLKLLGLNNQDNLKEILDTQFSKEE